MCIRGEAKPKSSAAVLYTTSGLKMPLDPQTLSMQPLDLLYCTNAVDLPAKIQ